MLKLKVICICLQVAKIKDADLSDWTTTIKAHCQHVFAFGRDRQRIVDTLGDQVTAIETLDQAFELAIQYAVKGDVVLLSPACASFDQFTNYQARGEYFEKLVGAHLVKFEVRRSDFVPLGSPYSFYSRSLCAYLSRVRDGCIKFG